MWTQQADAVTLRLAGGVCVVLMEREEQLCVLSAASMPHVEGPSCPLSAALSRGPATRAQVTTAWATYQGKASHGLSSAMV